MTNPENAARERQETADVRVVRFCETHTAALFREWGSLYSDGDTQQCPGRTGPGHSYLLYLFSITRHLRRTETRYSDGHATTSAPRKARESKETTRNQRQRGGFRGDRSRTNQIERRFYASVPPRSIRR